MSLILDSGALIALERNDRSMWRRLKTAQAERVALRSHGGVIGQVWRGNGPRQALLSRVIDAIAIEGLDAALGRAAGELLADSGTSDVIDAALVLLALDGDVVLTSDPDDIEPLARRAGLDVDLVRT